MIESDELKIKVLKLLSTEDRITPNRIARKLNSSHRTVKRVLMFLKSINLVDRDLVIIGEKRKIELYSLTELGKNVLRSMSKK